MDWRETWRLRQKVFHHDTLSGAQKWADKHQKEYEQPLLIDEHPKDGHVVYWELKKNIPVLIKKVDSGEVEDILKADSLEDAENLKRGIDIILNHEQYYTEIQEISVKWVVKTEEFKTFEFITKNDVYVQESDMNCDLFRLFIWNEGHAGFDEKTQQPKKIEILVANEEDYDIHEDVTHLFSLEDVVAHCLAVEERLDDMTPEYIKHYQERRERGEDV